MKSSKIVEFNRNQKTRKTNFKKKAFELIALGLIAVPFMGIMLALFIDWTEGDKTIMMICMGLSILCSYIADPAEFKEAIKLIFSPMREEDLYEDDEYADYWVEEVGAYYDPEEGRYFYYDEDEDEYFYFQ